jgi:hypothetical protein
VGEGEGEDEVLDEVEEVVLGSTSVDGPLEGLEDELGVGGMKVAVGPSVLVLVFVSVGGTPEDGSRHLGVLEASRKHSYPVAEGER